MQFKLSPRRGHMLNLAQTLWTSSEAEQPGASEVPAASGESKEAGDAAAPAATSVEPERAAAE